MTVLGDMRELPPGLVTVLDDLVEVAPGVKKRWRDCTRDDVLGSIDAGHEAVMDYQEIARLLERAVAENITISAEVFDRQPTDPDAPRRIALRNELRDLIAHGSATAGP